jgi:hypothetical protein
MYMSAISLTLVSLNRILVKKKEEGQISRTSKGIDFFHFLHKMNGNSQRKGCHRKKEMSW